MYITHRKTLLVVIIRHPSKHHTLSHISAPHVLLITLETEITHRQCTVLLRSVSSFSLFFLFLFFIHRRRPQFVYVPRTVSPVLDLYFLLPSSSSSFLFIRSSLFKPILTTEMLYDANTAQHLKPWLVRTLEPMSVHPSLATPLSVSDSMLNFYADATLSLARSRTTFLPF